MEEKVKFKYYRDLQNRPVVTICDLFLGGSLASRGIAICSTKDNPKKKTGKAIAEGRAKKALIKMKLDDPVWRDEAFEVVNALQGSFEYGYKSIFYQI